MFPAARIGDTITHDMIAPCGVIGPAPAGPSTVLIEGMPAATLGCITACTGVISAGLAHPPPPAPGAIAKGSMTVLIGGLPAARWAPAPDVGACGVFLGDPKLIGTRTTFIGG